MTEKDKIDNSIRWHDKMIERCERITKGVNYD